MNPYELSWTTINYWESCWTAESRRACLLRGANFLYIHRGGALAVLNLRNLSVNVSFVVPAHRARRAGDARVLELAEAVHASSWTCGVNLSCTRLGGTHTSSWTDEILAVSNSTSQTNALWRSKSAISTPPRFLCSWTTTTEFRLEIDNHLGGTHVSTCWDLNVKCNFAVLAYGALT